MRQGCAITCLKCSVTMYFIMINDPMLFSSTSIKRKISTYENPKDILNWNNAYTHTKTHTKVDVRPSKKWCEILLLSHRLCRKSKAKKNDIEVLLLPWWSISLDFSIRIFAIRLIVWLWSSLMYLSKKVIDWLIEIRFTNSPILLLLHYYYVLIAQKMSTSKMHNLNANVLGLLLDTLHILSFSLYLT